MNVTTYWPHEAQKVSCLCRPTHTKEENRYNIVRSIDMQTTSAISLCILSATFCGNIRNCRSVHGKLCIQHSFVWALKRELWMLPQDKSLVCVSYQCTFSVSNPISYFLSVILDCSWTTFNLSTGMEYVTAFLSKQDEAFGFYHMEKPTQTSAQARLSKTTSSWECFRKQSF